MKNCTVLCMNWGSKYGPLYVNRLYRMVKTHLSFSHRFVCFTDSSDGFDTQIESMPIPQLLLPNNIERGWKKLSSFKSPLYDITGQVLFLDLDIIIMNSIDDFFTYPGEFCIIKDWDQRRKGVGNSSVYRFEANHHAQILENYSKSPVAVAKVHRNEQRFLSDQIRLTYWPQTWCASFKHDCIPKFPLNYLTSPSCPPETKIVVFHGKPKISEASTGYHTLIPHRWTRPAPWIKARWESRFL